MQQDSQTDLDRFHANVTWLDKHYNELAAKHPEEWVAIQHEKLIGASPDLEDLVSNMKAGHHPIEDACFKFVPGKQSTRASVSGLSDLYGVWSDMDITEEVIEASKLKLGPVQI